MVCDIASGAVRPYLDRRNSERFKGVNDLVFDSRGNLYFTDQGQTGLHDPTGRLYRLRPDGQLDLLLGNVPSPNGVALSPDERVLYLGVTRGNAGLARAAAGRRQRRQGQRLLHVLRPERPGRPGGGRATAALIVANPGLGVAWVLNHRAEPEVVLRSCAGTSLTNVAFGGPTARRCTAPSRSAARCCEPRSTSPACRSIGRPASDAASQFNMETTHESIRPVRQGPRERRRRPHLRRPGRRKPRRRRVAAPLEHRARADASRAVGGVHGRDAWPSHRPARRLHGHARPGRAEPRHRRGLRAPRRDADGADHRPEGHHDARARRASRSSTSSRR